MGQKTQYGKMSVLPKYIHIFNVMPMKTPAGSLIETNKLILKFIQEGKRTRLAKIILAKSNKVGGSDFKT